MQWHVVTDNIDVLATATWTTIQIAVSTIILSVLLALPLAVARDSEIAPLRYLAASYSWFMRTVPVLTILFLAYYGLPGIGIYLPALPAAITVLSLSSAGYNMEFIRAGLRAIPQTQYEAARALGIPFPTALRRLILPQAMAVIVPPLTSNLTLLLKGSSLASLVAVTELTGQSSAIISETYRPIEILIVVAILYLAMNSVLIGAQKLVERTFAVPTAAHRS